MNINKLLSLCKGKRTYIQAHNFPDPDALASGHGLKRFLENFGIECVLFYDGLLDKRACKKMIDFFHIDAIPLSSLPELNDSDFLICVDSQKHAANVTPLKKEISACIDHHPTFVPAEYEYKDIRITGSCSSIIAEYFKKAKIEPDTDTANALLYGMKIDTRQFSRGVTDLDIDMLRFINDYCDDNVLRKISGNTIFFDDLKAYSSALETIQIYGTTGFAEIEFPCSDDIIAMISDFFLSLEELELCVVYSRRSDGIKFSVRSKLAEIHAGNWVKSAIGQIGSGGGHAYMAGGVIPPENFFALGQYPQETIRNIFLKAELEMKDSNQNP